MEEKDEDGFEKKNSLNVIRKNMVQRRTQMFEAGNSPPDISSKDQETPLEPSKPKITPKPRVLPNHNSPKPKDEGDSNTPKAKGAVAKRTVLFETTNHDQQNLDDTDCGKPPPLPVFSHAKTNPDSLTESQIVRPKTTMSPALVENKIPAYAQIDKTKKCNKAAKPPKPTIPKLDRMRGNRPPSDSHRYDGVVVLNSDPALPSAKPATPPAKPPRTFAHDQYLKVKAVKRKSKLENATQDDKSDEDKPYHETVHFPGSVHGGDSPDAYEEVGTPERRKAPGIPSSKPPLPRDPGKPPAKPKRPDRPPSITDKSPGAPETHAYEEINGKENGQKDNSKANGNVCHYEEIDSPNITERKKPNFQRVLSSPENTISHKKVVRPRQPPPPRPPPPDEEVPDTRWEKGFVRVNKHNARLKDDDFIPEKNLRNPSYGKKNSIILGCVHGEESGLKRFKSDEFLYAEVSEAAAKWSSTDSEAIYHDPVDIIPGIPGETGHLTEHGVVVDSEGYAIPDTGHHTVGNKHFRKNIQRSGTISTPRPTKLATSPTSPTATAIYKKRSPQVRDKLSRAYSVLRKRPSVESHDPPAPSLNCVPEDDEDSEGEVDPEEHKKRLNHVASIRQTRYGTLSNYASYRPRRKSRELYSYSLIVGLEQIEDSKQYKPVVLFAHPKEAAPANLSLIADFCFPDAGIWRPVTQYASESFSFVLTSSEGQQQYGYCKRILPPGTVNRLPEVYCVVTDIGAFSLYGQLLDAAEKQRTLCGNIAGVEELFTAGLNASLPSPGKEAWIHSRGSSKAKETLILKRNSDCRQEKVSFEPLVKKLSTENLLKVFASILLERRIIFVGQHLSTLTSCIHAVVSLLYPFTWQHTFVPILPAAMLEICCAPTPYIIGILTTAQPKLQDLSMERVLQVDLDNNRLLDQVGDEARIIPRKLQKALSTALKEDASDGVGCGSRDILVLEAFLRLFVETVGHFSDYILMQQDGKEIFVREQFVKAVSSKSIRMFLEWFTETQMFDVFITKVLDEQLNSELFEMRIEEYRQEMAEMSPSLRENFKEVGRKMLNFIMESGAKMKKVLNSNNVFV